LAKEIKNIFSCVKEKLLRLKEVPSNFTQILCTILNGTPMKHKTHSFSLSLSVVIFNCTTAATAAAKIIFV
jgi:hypothetical protein